MKLIILLFALFLPAYVYAQPIVSSAPATIAPLFTTGVVVGNGADTTEDTLDTYTLPAGIFQNVGDRIVINAAGSFAASTDTKVVRIRWGGGSGTVTVTPTGNTTGQVRWWATVTILKTGSNTQSYGSGANVLNSSNSGTSSGTATATDTNTIGIVLTGQNSTSATANSITCQTFTVDLIRAPAS